MPAVQASPGHRGCIGRDDQGERAGLHYQVRVGDVAAAIPKLADDHIGDGGAPAYLAPPSGQQDGIDVERRLAAGAMAQTTADTYARDLADFLRLAGQTLQERFGISHVTLQSARRPLAVGCGGS